MNIPRPLLYFFILLLTALAGGCAPTTWVEVTGEPVELAWPPPPKFAKVRFLYEIQGFQEEGVSISSIVFGKSDSGKILKPVAIAVGPDGRMAIADLQRRGVHLYIPSTKKYHFLFQAGDEVLSTPVGVTFSNDNSLFVSDSSLGKVLVYNADTSFERFINRLGEEPLLRPSGIAYNRSTNQLYVTDTLNHRIMVLNRHGHLLDGIGSRGAEPGYFNFPTHLALDSEGSVYVTDSMNFRAQIYSPSTGDWQMFGHHGNGSGDFASPKGIAVDASNIIYIAETLFDTVQVFNQYGIYLLNIGSQGNGPGEFWMPSGVHIDNKDRLYVCDTYNRRIQVFQLIVE
ncbi:MAG: 6-bladed beta-propeller [Desulfocapsa sp.]|nr:6-bladed beta-propeller [Desulfocapsa sp.]